MSFYNLEKIITKTGVISLAVLCVIGILAAFFSAVGLDIDLLVCKAIEDIFIFVMVVLGILVGFCFPASFLMNFSSIAVSLRKRRNEVE